MMIAAPLQRFRLSQTEFGPWMSVTLMVLTLVFLFGWLDTVDAKPKHKHKHKSYAKEDCFIPPGLAKQGKVPHGLAKQGKTPPGWSKKCKGKHSHSGYKEAVEINPQVPKSPCKNLVDLIPDDNKKLKNIAVGTAAGAAIGGAAGAGTGDPVTGTVFGAAVGGLIGATAGDHNDSGKSDKSNLMPKKSGDC